MARTYSRNLQIEDLPVQTNNILNTLARLRGITKKAIIREALVEYAKNHVEEIAMTTVQQPSLKIDLGDC